MPPRSAMFNLDDDKVAKNVFNGLWEQYAESGSEVFKYFLNIKDIYMQASMDHHFINHSNVTDSCFKESMLCSRQTNFMCDLNNYDTLYLYKYLKHDVYPSEYIMSYMHNFNAVQLKFKLRCGIIGLGCDLHRQKRDDCVCKYHRAFKSIRHFIFHCPAYMAVRE